MKKFLPIIVIALIIIVIVLLTASRPSEQTVIRDSGESVVTGITPFPSVIPGPDQNRDEESQLSANNEVLRPAQGDSSGELSVGISVGDRAPNFRLETFDGGIVELASLGKPVVLDFWAGWCPFCIEELPELEAVHQETINEVAFFGIHRSETESIERGKSFADDRGVTYALLKDSAGDVYNTYSGGQPFMPVAYFIDEEGVIVERKLGPKTAEQIRDSVEKLLE